MYPDRAAPSSFPYEVSSKVASLFAELSVAGYRLGYDGDSVDAALAIIAGYLREGYEDGQRDRVADENAGR